MIVSAKKRGCCYCPLFITIIIAFLFLFHDYSKSFAQDQLSKIMVDDFEIPGSRNSLGGGFGAFADKEGLGSCYLFFIQNRQRDISGDGKYYLHIQWDTFKKGAYGRVLDRA